MAKRPLTEDEVSVLENFKRIWAEKKRELKLTQEQVGLACGWSGQSAFSLYIQGINPIGVEAALRLAKVLKVHPAEIMPKINELLPETRQEMKPQDLPQRVDAQTELEQEALAIARMILELPSEQRAALRGVAEAFTHKENEQVKAKAVK
jgi:transcriptional regulator with XRE-family HTH domain